MNDESYLTGVVFIWKDHLARCIPRYTRGCTTYKGELLASLWTVRHFLQNVKVISKAVTDHDVVCV